MRQHIIHGPKPALPADPKDWVRVKGKPPKLIDDVDRAIIAAATKMNGDFTALLTGRQKKEYVHGSKTADQIVATQIVIAQAKELGLTQVTDRNIAEISKRVSMVMGRFGASRRLLIEKGRVRPEHVGGAEDE